MKEEETDKMLSEFFRQKLENAEITPSPSAGVNLMKRLGRREFLRFNPSRFNIWYAGTITAAATALAILLSSGPEKKNEIPQDNPPASVYNEVSGKTEAIDIPDATKESAGKNDQPRQRQKKAEKPITGSEQTGNQTIIDPKADQGSLPATGKITSLPATDILAGRDAGKSGLQNTSMKDTYIGASVTEGCVPLRISFRCLVSDHESCTWDFGDGGYSSSGNPEWLFDNAGEYKVTLRVFVASVEHVSYLIIKVFPGPSARFEIIPENAVLPRDEVIFRNHSVGAVKYRWDFGDGSGSDFAEPRHRYRKYDNYSVRLTAYSESGCTDTMVIENAFSESGCFIRFPNAFIPNPNGPSGGYYTQTSDESSQIFHPVLSGVTKYQLKIFNRRNVLIFETNDINYGWDGYYKGQLSDPGVYIWKVRGSFTSGEEFTKVGDVTLLKN